MSVETSSDDTGSIVASPAVLKEPEHEVLYTDAVDQAETFERAYPTTVNQGNLHNSVNVELK